MNAPPPKRSPPGKRISIALAVIVHLALAAFLIVGVRWQTKAPEAVEVELVQAPPDPAPPPPPEPEPAPAPKPEPKPEPPPPEKPDITVREKPKPPPKEAPKPKFDPTEMLRREDEAISARRAAEAAAHEATQRRQAEAASARSRSIADYSERIRAKIRGNIVLPPGLKGNPTARIEVVQLPSGEIITVRIARPSGHAGYDDAVDRAIHKSSPLPKPADPTLFERRLDLTFCPQEPCQ
ncbi:MAG: TonB C-terminal domain-containing protein [Candidatus Nitricoxidivorans perseverans]|uniref:TonB C-terminal domain-containing protein n=1 Tax=Candidatus Nitricoxidivorans perseverans TaxID=2975601 RepID=A0AA49ITR7_9PROT|nr:MAG: TonB C-terminal domain-containing protein [Candidatus Nitricoxidivorans perseverans]